MRSPVPALALLAALAAAGAADEPWAALSDAQIGALAFDDCHDDHGYVAPLSADLAHLADDPDRQRRFAAWRRTFDAWCDAQPREPGLRIRVLLSAASIVDLGRGEFEGECAYLVFQRLQRDLPRAQLIRLAAWVALQPTASSTLTRIEETGIAGSFDGQQVQERNGLYARKLLGRLLGKLP